MTLFSDESVTVGGRKMVMRKSGAVSGAAVVLVHPLGLDRRSFDAMRSEMDPSWRVVSYDQRGHATRSADDQFDLEDLVDDAVAVCLSMDSPVHLVGHALGGVVAALAAERLRSVQSLAVLAVPLKSQPAFSQRAESIEAGRVSAVLEESLSRWFKGLEAEPRYELAVEYGRSCLDAITTNGYAGGWRALAEFGELELSGTAVRTLCIAAEDDASVPLGSFNCLKGSDASTTVLVQFEVTPKGGHMFPIMEPQLTAALLDAFWKKAL